MITEDNVVVGIETVLYFTITDPRSATYEIANPLQAIEQLTVTTLRNVIGGLTLEETLTARENVNTELRVVLDEATGKWGIRINRVEIKSVDPPRGHPHGDGEADARRARPPRRDPHRRRREAGADPHRRGRQAGGRADRRGRPAGGGADAEGERQAAILRAEGEAKAIDTVFKAIHAGKPDRELLSYEYLQMLPQLAEGDANKVFVVPSEFAAGVRRHRRGALAARREAATRRRTRARPPCARRRRRPRTPDGAAPPRGRRARLRESSAMFDSLAEKLQGTLADVRQRGTLTEQDIDAAMREIRLALLEADVNFKVVRQFTAAAEGALPGRRDRRAAEPRPAGREDRRRGADRADGRRVGRRASASRRSPPTVILMAGLQGSGKTTAAAKLARYLREEHCSTVALAACDVYRPAAVEQLVKVGAQAGAAVYEQGTERDPVEIAALGARARHARRARTC